MSPTILLSFICVTLFVLCNVSQVLPIKELLLNPITLTPNTSYTIITFSLVHGGLLHLLFNLITLGSFGRLLEKIISRKLFYSLFFVSCLVCALTYLPFYMEPVLGISGFVCAIIGFIGTRFPNLPIYVFFINIKLLPFLVLFVSISIASLLFGFFPQTAHVMHLVGLFLGIIFAFFAPESEAENNIDNNIISSEIEMYLKGSSFKMPAYVKYLTSFHILSFFIFIGLSTINPSHPITFLTFTVSSTLLIPFIFKIPNYTFGRIYFFMVCFSYIWVNSNPSTFFTLVPLIVVAYSIYTFKYFSFITSSDYKSKFVNKHKKRLNELHRSYKGAISGYNNSDKSYPNN